MLSLLTIALSIAILTLPSVSPPKSSLPPPNLLSNTSCAFEVCEVPKAKREMSTARIYADVNELRPKEYWDYESLTVQWGSDSFHICYDS